MIWEDDLDKLGPNEKSAIVNALGVKEADIKRVSVLKKGMTNCSVLFECCGKKYILRIPGKGTDRLINRLQEAAVYQVIRGKGICDSNIYINPDNGYKIAEYLDGSRVCDPRDKRDVIKCMNKLHELHDKKLVVDHEFDIFAQIDFYESLWPKKCSEYEDYFEVKEKVFSLKEYIRVHVNEWVLTHIDAVPDNFLFFRDKEENEKVQLIDWEYAGMQDPHIDIAMFAIYAFYDKQQIDELIRIYCGKDCTDEIRVKIYCYVSACGLLWSNWCEYKRALGVDFGEYSRRQYDYAKDYYDVVRSTMEIETER